MWRGRGGRGEEVVSSKVITGMSQAVCLPHCRRGACDFHGRLRTGGSGGHPPEPALDFIVFKSSASRGDARLQPLCSPFQPPAPPREGGGERGPGAGTRRGCGGAGDAEGMRRRVSPGGLRDYWERVTGSGVCESVRACGGEPGPYSVKDLSRHARNL